MSGDEIKKIVAQYQARQEMPFDKKLQKELIALKETGEERLRDSISSNRKPDTLIAGIRASRNRSAARLCEILKQHGWPTVSLVGQEGEEAAFFILRNSSPAPLKIGLMPVIVAAAKAGEISRPDYASYVDRLRLDAGLKQIFGTQATIIDGFLVLFPIEAEATVDARRKQFQLTPLEDYIRFLQTVYRLPLMKSTGALTNRFSDSAKSSIASTTSAGIDLGQSVDEGEVIRVDTNLVSLNVSVHSARRTQVGPLSQKDFAVTEDNHEETITYFATTDVPFDLVLLLDLSGSTAGKRKLIRESTERFIKAARPSDRLAVVTFSDTPTIVSALTNDRTTLLKSIDSIDEGRGGSRVWDALKFTLDQVIGQRTLDRRRAVVFMTDGIDNALVGPRGGSSIIFSDLVETVRRNDALIIPIYLNTQSDDFDPEAFKRVRNNARRTLSLLADESGGLYYEAKKLEDLNGVYGEVIEDLGKVYSLGYKPTNEKHDHTWRVVKIIVPNRPDLITRARPGYYAN